MERLAREKEMQVHETIEEKIRLLNDRFNEMALKVDNCGQKTIIQNQSIKAFNSRVMSLEQIASQVNSILSAMNGSSYDLVMDSTTPYHCAEAEKFSSVFEEDFDKKKYINATTTFFPGGSSQSQRRVRNLSGTSTFSTSTQNFLKKFTTQKICIFF